MKIKLELSKNEESLLKEVLPSIVFSDNDGRWGHKRINELYIKEDCFIDLVNITHAILSKIIPLIKYFKNLRPICKDLFTSYKDKWFTDLEELDKKYNEASTTNTVKESQVDEKIEVAATVDKDNKSEAKSDKVDKSDSKNEKESEKKSNAKGNKSVLSNK